MKTLFIDLETSGLEEKNGHTILAIGAVVDQDGPEFNCLITPTVQEWKKASPKALEVNGLTWDVLSQGVSMQEAKNKFCYFLFVNNITKGNAVVVGQNPDFDKRFLRQHMGPELDFIGYPWDRPVDVRSLYSEAEKEGLVKHLDYRGGKNISIAIGVEPEPDVHDALEGAKVVRRNYNKLLELLNNGASGVKLEL